MGRYKNPKLSEYEAELDRSLCWSRDEAMIDELDAILATLDAHHDFLFTPGCFRTAPCEVEE